MTAVSIVGAGYVGLVTGVCLAAKGHRVVCVETDRAKVEQIRAGQAPIHEEGLDELLSETLGAGFSISDDLPAAVLDTDLTLIAVGTPSTPDGIDLRHVEGAAAEIGRVLAGKQEFHVVAVKSTVVPGSTDGAVVRALELASGKEAGSDFGLGVNPEFLTEGTAVSDFMYPDRIVIGASDERTAAVLQNLYEVFPDVETIVTNNSTAEMIKYASNALLATMISFSNELANLGAAVGGVDTVDVMRGVHASRYLTTDTPTGPVTADLASFLMAGCGFGGSCLPKDVTALVAHGRALGRPMPLLDAVLSVNAAQPDVMVELLERELGDPTGRRVGVLGLAFKPDTNDTRFSPAFPVIRRLVAKGAEVHTHDPIVTEHDVPAEIWEAIQHHPRLEDLIDGVDALMLVTSWADYHALPELLARRTEAPLLIDGRRIIGRGLVPRYAGIGL